MEFLSHIACAEVGSFTLTELSVEGGSKSGHGLARVWCGK